MKDAIKITEYNLIVNFILLVLLMIFSCLAFIAEKENNSLLYSSEKKDRFCYPDVMCAEPSPSQKSNTIFSIAPYSEDLIEQDIIFQYYNNNGGVSEQTFNIYLGTSSLPSDVITYNGLCAGYANYSSQGTSIYLYQYYKENGASWNANSDDIAGLLELAFKGTSSYTLNENSLINTNEEYITYKLNNNLSGVSMYSTQTGTSSLFNTESLNLEPIFGQTNNLVTSNVSGYYRNTLRTIKVANSSSGTCYHRCIDPSFASRFICGTYHSGDDDSNTVYFNDNVKLYVSSKNISTASGITVCDLNNGDDPFTDSCGIPFCYAGTNQENNYQKNMFSEEGTAKNPSTNDVLYKGNNVFSSGLNFYSTSDISTFNNAPQAQHLLFCGGTSIGYNNVSNDAMTTNSAKYPTSYPNNSNNKPEMADKPNAQVVGNKVILGFK